MVLVFKKSLHAFNTHSVISNHSISLSAVLLAIAAISIIGISNQEAFAVPPPGGQPAPTVVYNALADSATISWAPASGTPAVSEYRVLRSVNGGAFVLRCNGILPACPTSTTSFVDSTATLPNTNSVVYVYRPINADSIVPNGANAQNSLNATAIIIITPPPGAVTDLSLTVDSGTSVTLNWSVPLSSGIGINSYNVYRNLNGGGYGAALGISDLNTFTDNTLSPGDSVTYQVEAVNVVGTSDLSNEPAPVITTVTPPAVATNSTGGSGCYNCSPPTLGYNNIGKKLVDGGFTYNGKVADAEYFFTPYPLITVTVGQENVAELKIFEDAGPDAIRHVDLGFGLAKGEHMSQSKAVISYDIDFQGNGVISQVDPDNVIDDDSLKVNHQKVKCMESSNEERCLLVRIYHTFRDTLEFDIVATNVWDTKRNSWENLFNHGIHITGDSMNPAKEYDGINKGVIYHLTETSKTTAVDDLGNTWSLQYGVWAMDYKPVVRNDPANINDDKIWAVTKVLKGMSPQQISDLFGYDRNHNKFVEVKDGQMLIAESLMEKVCPGCVATPYSEINDIFYYEVPESMDRLHDIQIINKMKQESDKAQQLLLSIK